MKQKQQFQQQLLKWYDKHGRKNLPWQVEDAYFVWISEIMLQQTQVAKVIDYFNRFIKTFPNLEKLSSADVSEVLSHWSGLGYYNRARNIHKAALMCFEKYAGCLPEDLTQLMALPGIGKTTAAAILSLTWNKPYAILDGNVKRVMSRVFRLKADKSSQLNKKLWNQVEQLVSQKRARNYNQALMDLGSMICTRSKPKCLKCPLANLCQSYQTGVVDQYPQKKAKTKQIAVTLHALLYFKGDCVFLQKRQNKGIWPELWFLPLAHSIVENQDARIVSFAIKHILSHRILTINVYVMKEINRQQEGQWISIKDLNETPHPSALTRVLNEIN